MSSFLPAESVSLLKRGDHPRPAEAHGRRTGLDLLVGADRVRTADLLVAGHVALLHQTEVPAQRVLEGRLVQVELRAPRVLVGGLPARAAGERRPLRLAPATAAGALGGEAVRLDVGLVEARLVTPDALRVDGEMRDELLERAAVLGVPAEVLQLGRIHAGRLERGRVVEDGDRVPVLRGAVPLAVLALPQFRQARLVVAVLDVAGRAEVVERAEDLQIDVLGELRQVVGEDVGCGVGDEARGELGPVGVPAVLRDVDLQAGIGLLERVGALLVARLLGRVPQPVLDGAVRAAAGGAAAGGQGARGEQGDRGRGSVAGR